MAMPAELAEDRPLKLGSTMLGDTAEGAYYTFKYDFQLESMQQAQTADLLMCGEREEQVILVPELPEQIAFHYEGTFDVLQPRPGADLDCVAVFDGTGWTLQLLSGRLQTKHRKGEPLIPGYNVEHDTNTAANEAAEVTSAAQDKQEPADATAEHEIDQDLDDALEAALFAEGAGPASGLQPPAVELAPVVAAAVASAGPVPAISSPQQPQHIQRSQHVPTARQQELKQGQGVAEPEIKQQHKQQQQQQRWPQQVQHEVQQRQQPLQQAQQQQQQQQQQQPVPQQQVQHQVQQCQQTQQPVPQQQMQHQVQQLQQPVVQHQQLAQVQAEHSDQEDEESDDPWNAFAAGDEAANASTAMSGLHMQPAGSMQPMAATQPRVLAGHPATAAVGPRHGHAAAPVSLLQQQQPQQQQMAAAGKPSGQASAPLHPGAAAVPAAAAGASGGLRVVLGHDQDEDDDNSHALHECSEDESDGVGVEVF